MEVVNTNGLINKSSSELCKKDKESSQNFRNRTKVIAYLNIVYFSIQLPFVLLLLFTSIWSTAFYNEVEIPQGIRPFPYFTNTVNLIYIWCVTVLLGIEVVIQLSASFVLLRSTEVVAHLQLALVQARVWRNITIGYTIANILNIMIAPWINLYAGIYLLVRVCMIFNVHKYINQLENQIVTLAAKKVYVEV